MRGSTGDHEVRSGTVTLAGSHAVPDEQTPILPGSSPAHTQQYRTISRRSLPDIFLVPDEAEDSDVEQHEPLDEPDEPETPKKSPWGTLSALLLGVFVAQVDQSLVLTTYGQVASDFDQLYLGSWIISAYTLAQCAVQPLYGKLSDIYSRKACLITAYILFAVGTAGAGLSNSMGEIIAWRAVQGAGGSGMVSIVSIIITDIVPKRNVALIRSYVNILQTTGRSCGGIIGGQLTQSVGWRWAFLVQVPPTLAAIALVALALSLPPPPAPPTSAPDTGSIQTQLDKLRRVDFAGATLLLLTILAMCLVIELGGQRLSWDSPYIFGLLGIGTTTGFGFVISAMFTTEPIFPLRILAKRTVLTNYLVVLLSVTAQVSLMSAVPLYFQVTTHASTGAAGAYLIPAFVGNTLGGLLAGYWIKYTGRYKTATVVAPLVSVFCMVLVLLTWQGKTTPLESVFSFPGGFAMGIVYASTFVGLIAGLDESDVAISASGMYLFFNIGAISGVSAGSAASQGATRAALEKSLSGVDGKLKIIERALADISYVWQVKNEDVRKKLIAAYTLGFHAVNWLGIICSSVAFLVALMSNNAPLEKAKRIT